MSRSEKAHVKANDPQQGDGEDLGLVALLRTGDLNAFERLYRRHQPRLARFVGNLIWSSQAVEEVVDDTLLVLWERPASFAGKSKLSTWLFAIAYRKALHARQCRPALAEPPYAIEPEPAPGDRMTREQARASLLSAMQELSPEHRAVVDLTYWHEAGYREIAEIMNCPVDTVKTRMFHARRHLRRKLAGELNDWI